MFFAAATLVVKSGTLFLFHLLAAVDHVQSSAICELPGYYCTGRLRALGSSNSPPPAGRMHIESCMKAGRDTKLSSSHA